MAKKDPTDLTVEEKLNALYELQTVLSGIDEQRAERGELPYEVHDLEDEIEGLHTRVEKIETEINDFKNAVVQKQQEIQEAQESVERYKKQLDDVANNRQYDMLTKEIEFQTLEIDLCNKKIKEGKIKAEEKEKELAETNELIATRTEDLEEKKVLLAEIMQKTKAKEDELNAKAEELEKKIEPRLLKSFLRIRKGARNGLGIVAVQRDACGGCFNKIPPQRQLDIKMHKKIIVCEYCGRILVDPELAGIKAEPAEEAKPKRKRAIRKKKEESEEE